MMIFQYSVLNDNMQWKKEKFSFYSADKKIHWSPKADQLPYTYLNNYWQMLDLSFLQMSELLLKNPHLHLIYWWMTGLSANAESKCKCPSTADNYSKRKGSLWLVMTYTTEVTTCPILALKSVQLFVYSMLFEIKASTVKQLIESVKTRRK